MADEQNLEILLQENARTLGNNVHALLEIYAEGRKQLPWHKRAVLWWVEKLIPIYRLLRPDPSKLLGYPMTHSQYQKWVKEGGVRYFLCDGYEVCNGKKEKSPHKPDGEGWMVCVMPSVHGFTCGKVTRAHDYEKVGHQVPI